MGEVYRALDTRLGRKVALEGSADGAPLEPGGPRALRARGPLRIRAEPSQHRHDLRGRPRRLLAVSRDGAHRRLDAAAPHGERAASRQEDPRHRGADRERSRQGARGRHRSPGPEAREHHGLAGRVREDPGLRPGQAAGTLARRFGAAGRLADEGGPDHRDSRLHVARTGGRTSARFPLRPVLRRPRLLRDADPAPPLPPRDSGPDALGDHPGGAAPARWPGFPRAASAALGDRALPREGPRRSLRLDGRARARAEADPGQALRIPALRRPRVPPRGCAARDSGGFAPAVQRPRAGGPHAPDSAARRGARPGRPCSRIRARPRPRARPLRRRRLRGQLVPRPADRCAGADLERQPARRADDARARLRAARRTGRPWRF